MDEMQVVPGARALAAAGETSATAQAAQAAAIVQAQFAIAARFPRDLDVVRERVLKECRRPSFAAVAEYAKPIGGSTVRGPSIRMAEMLVRALGNVRVSTSTLYEDAEKQVIRISATDLETNLEFSQDLTIRKTVERKNPKGRVVIGERVNTSGEKTYLVQATDDEMLTVLAAHSSKSIRTTALRLVPGDLVAEALGQCKVTRTADDAKDPDAVKKRILDAFSGWGVSPDQVKAHMKKDLTAVTAAEVEYLRGLVTALAEGETWASLTGEEKKPDQSAPPAPPPAAPPAPAPTAPHNETPTEAAPPAPAAADPMDTAATATAMKRFAGGQGATKMAFAQRFSVAAKGNPELERVYETCLKAIRK